MSLILGILDSGGAAAGAVGTYESIQTVTVGSGGQATVSFTSIPSTYKHLQIRAIARSTIAGSNADNVAFRINADTGSNYTTHRLTGSDTANAAGFVSLDYGYLPSTIPSSGTLSNTFGGIVMDLLDYTNTNKNKTLRALTGFDENGHSGNAGAARIQLSSCLWNSTSSITSIEFVNSGTFAQYTQFALYGIKDS
jgi:hypothetical protein